MKKINILILVAMLTLNCSKKNEKITLEKTEDLTELKDKVYKTCDEAAFMDLILKTGNSKYPYEILPYAMIMANKYNNGEGCHQILLGIMSLNNPKVYGYDLSIVNNLNEVDKRFVVSYLVKGAKLKNINCILALEEMYKNGWGVNKDIKKADELDKEYKSISK